MRSEKNISATHFIERQDCVLVVVDIQERLLPFIAEKERVVKNTIRLIKFARIVDVPIILTEQDNLGKTVPEITSELIDIRPIVKIEFSCCGSGKFTEKLSRLQRNTLILTGIETHVCIMQTALDALAGYRVQAVSDAVSSRLLHNWEIGLRRMQQAGVTLTTAEMVIFELLRKAGTDEFRAALKLVK